MEPRRYRALWISDVHLGTRDSNAALLVDFLRHHDADHWYLVGDVFDGWAMSRGWYWSPAHNDVVQKLLRKARKGDAVTYIPGNHDDFARGFAGLKFGGITVRERAVHTTADGRQLLVLHGDEFDGIVRHAAWLSKLGAGAYQMALGANRYVNKARSRLGLPHHSRSAGLGLKAKRAVQYVADFGQAVADEARRGEVDGVVCGHIHHAEMRDVRGVAYYNCGDWVESCTALAEHYDGRMEILRWHAPLAPPQHEPAPHYAGSDGLPAEALALDSLLGAAARYAPAPA